MTFQTIDLSVRTSQELDFRLTTSSKNNLREIYNALRFPVRSIILSCPRIGWRWTWSNMASEEQENCKFTLESDSKAFNL